MNDKVTSKKILLIVFVFSFAIRILFGIFIFKKEGTSIFNDDWQYINYAKNIMSQGIFVPDIIKLNQGMSTKDGLKGSAASIVGPGFSLIIAFSFKVFGEKFFPIIALNALISALLCVLIFYICRELVNEKVAILAALWSTFYILFIIYTPHVLKENWLAFLFPLIIFLFLKETKRNKISLYFLILFSVLYAFLIHMDERFFTYFPALLIGFIFLDRDSWKKGLKKALVVFSLILIFMVPWLIRNFNVYDRVVILTERTAGFTDKFFGYKEEVEKLKNKEHEILALWEKATELLLEGKEVTFKVSYLDNLKTAIKLGYIPHRFSRLEKWISEFKELWRPFRFKGGFVGDGYRFEGPSWSLKHNLSVGLTYGLLLPFFLMGILFILKNKNWYGIFILLIIVIHTVVHVVMAHARNRYRIPIDAFIITIAFYGLQQLYLKFEKWKKMNKVSA